jgi:glycosyltransferase involved in cell wall biosynthesis
MCNLHDGQDMRNHQPIGSEAPRKQQEKGSYRILYIHATQVPPPKDPLRDRFFLFSGTLCGDVIQPIWFETPETIEQELGPGADRDYLRGSFRFHWIRFSRQALTYTWRRVSAYIFLGWKLHRKEPYDCIVVYSHLLTGLCGTILKLLTGTKLIIEIATSPANYFGAETPTPTFRDYLRFWYSEISLHISCLAADRIHVLGPHILTPYRLLRNRPQSVFHEFVNFSSIQPDAAKRENVILLVGSPWYLKGADLLVHAFERLMNDYPDVRLQLLGFFPDREALDKVIRGNARVTVTGPVENPEAVKIISTARILVLPSRCEGMGRVLIEAMAAGVPVIGSDVGGIPHMIRHGENGLVFPSGNIGALEQCLRTILSDPALAERMGQAGKELAAEEFNEKRYVEHFVEMVDAAVRGAR